MKFKNRLLSLLLALAMVITFMPALAFANDGKGIDAGIREIKLDESVVVDIETGGDYTVIKFAPEESGWYCFKGLSEDEDADLSIDIYENYEDFISGENFIYSGFGNLNYNFSAYAEQTYYLRASFASETTTGSFTIRLTEGVEPVDYGNPKSLTVIPAGTYTAYCTYDRDGYFDEDGDWIATSDDYLKYRTPWYNEGDQIKIEYEKLEDPVVYTAKYFEDDGVYLVDENNNIADDLYLQIKWDREQSYDNQFEADSYEKFHFYLPYWSSGSESYVISDEFEAYLAPYDDDDDDEGNEFTGDVVAKGTINVGETKKISINNSYDYASFEFTPSVSGIYCFRSDSARDPVGRILDSEFNVLYRQDDWEKDDESYFYNFAINFNAEQGKTYYLQACLYGSGTGTFTVELLSGEHEPENQGGYNYDGYDGVYSGNPVLEIQDYTDSSTNYLYYNERFVPSSGDVIMVDTGEGTKSYTYEGYNDGHWYVNEDNTDRIVIDDYWYDEYESELHLYARNGDWSVQIPLKIGINNNTVERITFEPANIYLTDENIVEHEDGDTYYYFGNRSKHSAGGQTWSSKFAVGDKLTVYYKGGKTKTFVNTDKHFTNTYEDEETGEIIQRDYYSDVFTDGEYLLNPNCDRTYLKMGSNVVNIYWHGAVIPINVTVETAAQKATREAAEKAAAEKAAAEKAAAEKAAAEKAAAEKAAAEKAAAEQAELAKTAAGTTHTVSSSKYKVLTNASGTNSGAVAFITAKNAKSVTVPATVKLNGKTFKVTQVNANAFKGKKIRTVTIGKNVKTIKKNAFKKSPATKIILKTKLLKKAMVKGCLKGSKIKTVQVKVGSKSQNKKTVKSYKKIFTKANAGKTVIVK